MKKTVCDVCGADIPHRVYGTRGSNGEWITLALKADWDRYGNADVCHECLIKALTGEAA